MRSSLYDACPDEQAMRARQGALSAAEWEKYRAHLSACADCRIAWSVMRDFQQSAAPAPGDELLLQRASRLALATSRGRGRGRPIRAAIAAASILLLAGVASGAILLRVRHAGVPAPHLSPPRPSRTTRSTARHDAAVLHAPPESEPPAVAGPPPPIIMGSAARRVPRHVPSPARASNVPPRVEDAEALFVRAVSEREQGRTSEALSTFRALQSRYPQTPQATLSFVSLADLALDAGDASTALGAFDRYLAAAPSGLLLPECLAGKARALNLLGRSAEADAVWQEIATRFPTSPYARRMTGNGQEAP